MGCVSSKESNPLTNIKVVSLDTDWEAEQPVVLREDTMMQVAGSALKGGRSYQEDRFDFVCSGAGVTYLAVFDGHGGDGVSDHLRQELAKKVYDGLIAGLTAEESLTHALTTAESNIHASNEERILSSGSTAVVSLVIRQSTEHEGRSVIVCAWIGDSRCVVVKRSGRFKEISRDHRPDREDERKRVLDAGGNIVKAGGVTRVMPGGLSVSRSLGDVDLKNNCDGLILSTPEVTVHTLQADDEFIVLASDGLWDHFSTRQASEFIAKLSQVPCDIIAKVLVAEGVSRGSADNVSAVVSRFTPEMRAILSAAG